MWADAYVFAEARRNLAAKTPTGLPVLNAMAARISIGGLIAGNRLLPDTMVLPEKDRPVLAAAIDHRCDILVTGDRTHFGPAPWHDDTRRKRPVAGDAGGGRIGLMLRRIASADS